MREGNSTLVSAKGAPLEDPAAGARDVERLFEGEFGAEYTARNRAADPRKPAFFHDLFRRNGVQRALECGCNLGLNLSACIAGGIDVWGIDIQRGAIQDAWATRGGGNFVVGSILDLPFRDGYFDVAFTCGVLIHVPPPGLRAVMSEMVRVSRRYVLSAEYHDENEVAVPWRGQSAALWRRNYRALWQQYFPDLQLVEEGYKGPEEGFDRITWHLFRKP
jgi:pseudaminic acid biosynthesis-associated methylase